MVPRSAASGSVVGLPCCVERPAFGNFLAALLRRHDVAARHLRQRQVDHQRRRPGSGQANATGLVPNTAREPPHGAIAPGVLTNISATRPLSASRSTGWPAAPQWLDWRIAAAAMPCFARGRAESRPRPVRSPERQSRSRHRPRSGPGRGRLATGVAAAVDLPHLRLRGIHRHARQAVALEPVAFGGDQRAGDAPGIVRCWCGSASASAPRVLPPEPASASAWCGAGSRAPVKLRHHILAVAERLRGGEPAVGRAHDHVDQRVAGLRDRHVAAQDAGHVDVDVLAHGADGLRIAGDLDHRHDRIADHVALAGREGVHGIARRRHQGHAFGRRRRRVHVIETRRPCAAPRPAPARRCSGTRGRSSRDCRAPSPRWWSGRRRCCPWSAASSDRSSVLCAWITSSS